MRDPFSFEEVYLVARKSAFVLITILLLLVLAEVGSFAIGKYVIPDSPISFILHDPGFEPEQNKVDRYFEQRDSILGWPAKEDYGTERYDTAGTRPLPSFPQSADACVSAYGDSYTYSTHVGPADAWSNLVAKRMGCRVANYGVSGYGTDQAHLRFVNNPGDEADFTILGVATVDIIRLVNQDRSLLWRSDQGILLKPRYAQGNDNTLILIEVPQIGPAELGQYVESPSRFLSHEWFLPDTPDGPTVLEFPFSITMARSVLNPRVVDKLLGNPSWIRYYDPDHPSGALPLLIRITEEFVQLAVERGMRPLVLIIPTSQDLIYAREESVDPSIAYVQALQEKSIEHLQILPHMLSYIGEDDVCDVFTEKTWLGFCWGHYNAEGEEVIASLVYDKLQRMAIAAK